MSSEDWTLVGIVVALILVCIIFVLVKKRRENNQYNKSSVSVSTYREDPLNSDDRSSDREGQIYRSYCSESEKTDGSDGNNEFDDSASSEENEDDTYPELEECRGRVVNLIERLKSFWPIKAIENFDEDMELNGEGYMFSLVEFAVDHGKMWVIFYPNKICDVIALVFDQEASWVVVEKAKDIIDEFFGNDEPDLYSDEDEGYPAYIWGDGDCDDLGDDLTKAAEKSPIWKELSEQF